MPEREDDVGLEDVERVALERRQQLLEAARHLAARDRHAGLLAQRAHAGEVLARQRLLDPGDVVLGEPLDDRRASRGRSSPGLVSPGIRHHWLRSTRMSMVVADRVRGWPPRTATPSSSAAAGDADLERAEPRFAQRERVLGPLGRGAQLRQRRVGRQPVDRAAEQRRARDAERLPGEVVQRGLDRPRPAGVELDSRQRRARAGRGAAGPPPRAALRTGRSRRAGRRCRCRPAPRRCSRARAWPRRRCAGPGPTRRTTAGRAGAPDVRWRCR